ncbi:ABC transporter permease [Streptomyces sp. RB6PN25]|uniref:ABC transporter permease n=1 Tax=Streptomyces humicola TaxID=2953240 RepID=A0ABT1Q2Q3_9ACTN|nr:ABC transporter permease [Streptomyces humicola]MCQ4084201.1 ABC transporter permease [Streptomyces humicola]
MNRTAREAVGLIAQRELTMRLRSRAFRITLVLMVLMVVGMNIALHLAHNSGPSIIRIGLLRQDTALSAPLQAADRNVAAVTVPDLASGQSDVRKGTLAAFVRSGPDGLAVTVAKTLDPTLGGALTTVARERALAAQIIRLGGDPVLVARAAGAATVHVTSLQPPAPARDQQRLIFGIVVRLLLYLTFMICGPLIAQGVVEEKSSRVVELLLATVRPWQLMVGKVLGTGALGLLQIVVVGGAGLISARLARTLTLPLSGSLGTLAWSLAWFLAGFALFSLLFAAAGSLVSRQEDLSGVQFPVLAPIIIAWVLGISTLPGHPDSGLVAALSMVPFFAPVLMPMRIALGTAPVWQAFTALGLTLLLAFLMVRLASRIYRNSVLRSGARVTWREALRAA